MNLPLSPITHQEDTVLNLTGAREEIPCHLYAVHALQVAVESGSRWIRVHKQGHVCELDVNRLVKQCQDNAATVPRAVIYTRREHELVGNWTDPGRTFWPGMERA
jgi:hypothetical protein